MTKPNNPLPPETAVPPLVLERVFAAPAHVLWRAWTDPAIMSQWFGPESTQCLGVTADVRPGGRFRIQMRTERGDFTAFGTYEEVVPVRRLRFSWQWEHYAMPDSMLTVQFEDLGGQTRITLTHAGFPDAEDRQEHEHGWTSLLAKLDQVWPGFASSQTTGPVVLERVFNAPIELVWQAISEPARVAEWFVAMPQLRAEVGQEFTFDSECGVHRCRVTQVVPGRVLAYTWGYLEIPEESLVTFELFPEGAQTRLKLTHSGIEQLPPLPKFAREGFLAGWTHFAGNCLPAYLEQIATADRELVVSREFDAPRELVWQAWTQPEHVAQWWGPHGFTTKISLMEVRVGGVWEHVMRGPDGKEYPNFSHFEEVVPFERIVYTHGGRRAGGPEVHGRFIWTFESLGPKRTRLTIRQVYPTTAERDRVIREFGALEGARQTFERLAEFLVQKGR